MYSTLAQAFFVHFQKTQGQPQKNSIPILTKKLRLMEAVSDFTKKIQEISGQNFRFFFRVTPFISF